MLLIVRHHSSGKNRETDSYGNHDCVDGGIKPTAAFDCVLEVNSENRDCKERGGRDPASNGTQDRDACI
jgi:hypothetical protein